MTERSVVRGSRSAAKSLALCVLLTMTTFIYSPDLASAQATASTQCHGYFACSQGTFTTHSYHAHEWTPYWSMYAGNNCTNYVAFVESTIYGVVTPSHRLGDAGQWPTTATLDRALVNHTPTIGSVAEWDGGSPGIPSPGHVAIVEEVGPHNSYIVISQQNISDVDGYNWTRINANNSGNQWEEWPSNFIHFTFGRTALVENTQSRIARIVVRVIPASFATNQFEFYDGVERLVAPGLITSLRTGVHSKDYDIGLHNQSLRSRYSLNVTVSGSNIQVLRQGSPYTSAKPRIRISGVGNAQGASIVTITIRPKAPSSTTTTAVPTTTSIVPSATTTTTSMVR